MPKKRHFHFKPLQSTTSTPHNRTESSTADTSPSVNERLSELRRLEGKDAAAKRRQLAENVNNQRSVPPEAQRILGVSESAPPKPRKDVSARARERLRGTPGPAPPRSWVKGGGGVGGWGGSLVVRGQGRGGKVEANDLVRDRPRELLRFARLTATLDRWEVEGTPSRLSHLALKTTARLWDGVEEGDYPALAEIPLRIRLRLLSYIVFYGPPITPAGLQALLQGGESIHELDLAGLVGHRGLTLRKIQKFLELDEEPSPGKSEDSLLESWDAEPSLSTTTFQSDSPSARFATLTHLSLSHPTVTGASWKDLLSLTKHTPQLTHLSLAHWPRPTLTPNLSTATISTPTRQEVAAGGSNYYSALDSDMEEPASLIRQLSGNLLCLEWLDLEGCADWLPALLRLAAELAPEHQFAHDRLVRWTDDRPSRGRDEPHKWFSVFVSNWKNLSYVRVAQPGLPTLCGLRALLGDSSFAASSMERKIAVKLQAHLSEDLAALVREGDPPREVVEVQKRRCWMWLQQERKAVETALRINDVRKLRGAGMVVFDHGWMRTLTSYGVSGY